MLFLLSLTAFFVSYKIFVRFFYQKLAKNLSSSYVVPKRFYLYFLFGLSIICFFISISLFKSFAFQVASLFAIYFAFALFFFISGFKIIGGFIIHTIEYFIKMNLLLFSLASILVIGLIFYSIFVNSYIFFSEVGITNFLFKTNWSPEHYEFDIANSFGIIPLVINTFYITLFSLVVSFAFGMLIAIYLSEYVKSKRTRFMLKSTFEIVAGIPSIFYGFFGAFILAPKLADFGRLINIDISLESIIVPGIAIGIMMVPYVATLLDDAFSSIPKTLKDASTAMGLTRFETIKKLVLPISFPEIISTLIIVISRVLGETMVVLLTCGIVATMTFNPLNPSTTITVQIVHLLTGDTSFDSPKTLSVFALSLFLFCATMVLNIISIRIKNRAQSY
jgi:phosphate transport system permease protein